MSLEFRVGSVNFNENQPSALQASDTSSFHQVTFSSPFDPGRRIIVVPFVQSFNGAETPGLRITDVSNTGFRIRMNELVAKVPGITGASALSDGPHINEEIGYIAVQLPN